MLAQEIAAAKGFHDRNADAPALAFFVELLPFRVHIDELILVVIGSPELRYVIGTGQQVVAGVDAEHEHVNEAAAHSQESCLGVMAGKADRADDALLF